MELDLVTEEEAKLKPVGQAREEPNALPPPQYFLNEQNKKGFQENQ